MGWTHTRSKIAQTKRYNPQADVTELRRQLKAERLEHYIRTTVDAAPELSADQRRRCASLLRGGGRDAR